MVPVHELNNLTVKALILEETPCLLSIGQLCLRDGFSFAWDEGESPTLTHKKSGLCIQCQHSHNVPLITPAESLQLEFPRGLAGGDASRNPEPEAHA